MIRRCNIGGFQAPGQLAGAAAITVLAPGFAYAENFDLDIPMLNDTQNFNHATARFAVGRSQLKTRVWL